MKCFILVGEPSGDIHAAELIKELSALNNEIVGTLDLKTFLTMMHYEQERTKANPLLSSNLVVFYFENIYIFYINLIL